MEDWDDLNEIERVRLIFLLFRYFKCLESLHYQYLEGILDERLWVGWRNQLAEYSNTKAGKLYLSTRSKWYSPEFIEFVGTLAPVQTHVSAGRLASQD